MNPQFYPCIGAPGNTEVFDPVAQFIGVSDVLPFYPADALGVGLLELQWDAEGDGTQDGQLVRRIDTLNIKRRVGFRVA